MLITAPPPLSAKTHVPPLSYHIRQPLNRPPNVQGSLDVKLKREWKYIVIHHSASTSGSAAVFDRYHNHRTDLITTLSFGVSQKLIEDDRWGDLILHGLINWTNANSDVTGRDGVDPFTYDRVVYGVQLEWAW